jgi:hypothetical protein
MVLAPRLACKGFSLMIYGQRSRIDAFELDAVA